MTATSNGTNHAIYGGVYRAVCLEVLSDQARALIPQLFATATVTIYEFAGGRPAAGDEGWVAFESGLAEHPIWIGSESKGGGGGVAAYPPYYAFTVNVNVDNASGGQASVSILDGSVKAAYDGWIEVAAAGGYAGMSVAGPLNTRQALVCPDLTDPLGAGWTVAGEAVGVNAGTWDLVGDCHINVPVLKDQTPRVTWQGQWTPTSYVCSFRSYVGVKFYSAKLLGEGTGATGGGAAHGVPVGGTPGQVLAKQTASDYDTHWISVAGSIASYRHIQTAASALWTIPHNLGFYPNVAVVDSSGREVIGEIDYVDMNTVRLTFSAAFGGEAYLS